MSRGKRILVVAVSILVLAMGCAGLMWWALVPHPLTGEAALTDIRRSFDADFPPTFTRIAVVRSVFGPGSALIAEPESRFVIGILNGLNSQQAVAAGELPDSDPPANWSLAGTETRPIRGHDETVFIYSGVRSDGRSMRGWVVKFAGNDGVVKISLMGFEEGFDDAVALTFIESIR